MSAVPYHISALIERLASRDNDHVVMALVDLRRELQSLAKPRAGAAGSTSGAGGASAPTPAPLILSQAAEESVMRALLRMLARRCRPDVQEEAIRTVPVLVRGAHFAACVELAVDYLCAQLVRVPSDAESERNAFGGEDLEESYAASSSSSSSSSNSAASAAAALSRLVSRDVAQLACCALVPALGEAGTPANATLPRLVARLVRELTPAAEGKACGAAVLAQDALVSILRVVLEEHGGALFGGRLVESEALLGVLLSLVQRGGSSSNSSGPALQSAKRCLAVLAPLAEASAFESFVERALPENGAADASSARGLFELLATTGEHAAAHLSASLVLTRIVPLLRSYLAARDARSDAASCEERASALLALEALLRHSPHLLNQRVAVQSLVRDVVLPAASFDPNVVAPDSDDEMEEAASAAAVAVPRGGSTGSFGDDAGGFGDDAGGFGDDVGGFGDDAGGFGDSAGGFGSFGEAGDAPYRADNGDADEGYASDDDDQSWVVRRAGVKCARAMIDALTAARRRASAPARVERLLATLAPALGDLLGARLDERVPHIRVEVLAAFAALLHLAGGRKPAIACVSTAARGRRVSRAIVDALRREAGARLRKADTLGGSLYLQLHADAEAIAASWVSLVQGDDAILRALVQETRVGASTSAIKAVRAALLAPEHERDRAVSLDAASVVAFLLRAASDAASPSAAAAAAAVSASSAIDSSGASSGASDDSLSAADAAAVLAYATLGEWVELRAADREVRSAACVHVAHCLDLQRSPLASAAVKSAALQCAGALAASAANAGDMARVLEHAIAGLERRGMRAACALVAARMLRASTSVGNGGVSGALASVESAAASALAHLRLKDAHVRRAASVLLLDVLHVAEAHAHALASLDSTAALHALSGALARGSPIDAPAHVTALVALSARLEPALFALARSTAVDSFAVVAHVALPAAEGADERASTERALDELAALAGRVSVDDSALDSTLAALASLNGERASVRAIASALAHAPAALRDSRIVRLRQALLTVGVAWSPLDLAVLGHLARSSLTLDLTEMRALALSSARDSSATSALSAAISSNSNASSSPALEGAAGAALAAALINPASSAAAAAFVFSFEPTPAVVSALTCLADRSELAGATTSAMLAERAADFVVAALATHGATGDARLTSALASCLAQWLAQWPECATSLVTAAYDSATLAVRRLLLSAWREALLTPSPRLAEAAAVLLATALGGGTSAIVRHRSPSEWDNALAVACEAAACAQLLARATTSSAAGEALAALLLDSSAIEAALTHVVQFGPISRRVDRAAPLRRAALGSLVELAESGLADEAWPVLLAGAHAGVSDDDLETRLVAHRLLVSAAEAWRVSDSPEPSAAAPAIARDGRGAWPLVAAALAAQIESSPSATAVEQEREDHARGRSSALACARRLLEIARGTPSALLFPLDALERLDAVVLAAKDAAAAALSSTASGDSA